LFLVKKEITQGQVEIFNRVVAIEQTRVEFAFAQREDVGAELQALLGGFGDEGAVALFEQCAAFAFFKRLHPQGFGDVGDAFGQAVISASAATL
jgi:hypothetical protein